MQEVAREKWKWLWSKINDEKGEGWKAEEVNEWWKMTFKKVQHREDEEGKYACYGVSGKWLLMISDFITAISTHTRSITSVISGKTETDSISYEYERWLNSTEMKTTTANTIRKLFSGRL